MRSKKLLYLSVMAVLAISRLSAQVGDAPVQGTVKDPSGAVVPNAQMVLTEVATSVVQKTTTNSAGLYFFPASPLGAYTMTVTVPGMDKWQGNIVLEAGLSAEV